MQQTITHHKKEKEMHAYFYILVELWQSFHIIHSCQCRSLGEYQLQCWRHFRQRPELLNTSMQIVLAAICLVGHQQVPCMIATVICLILVSTLLCAQQMPIELGTVLHWKQGDADLGIDLAADGQTDLGTYIGSQ